MDRIKLTVIAMIIAIAAIVAIILIDAHQNPYSGVIVEKYITPGGYKTSPVPCIVFYNDSLKRNLVVKVTHNDYNNFYIGQKVKFNLSKNELRW